MHQIVSQLLNTLQILHPVSSAATIESKSPFQAWFQIFLVMFSCPSKVVSWRDQKYTLNSFSQSCCNQALRLQFKQLQFSSFQMETSKSRENKEDTPAPKNRLVCRISSLESFLEALFWMSLLLHWNKYLHYQDPFIETLNFQNLKFWLPEDHLHLFWLEYYQLSDLNEWYHNNWAMQHL